MVTGSPVGLALQHNYASPGTRTITVDLYDEDGTHLAAGSKTITVSAPHDLGVSRTGRHAIVSGRVARFGITVSNLGTDPATGVFVTFQLPAGMSIVQTPNWPWVKIAPRRFRLDVGTLAAGEEATVYFKARVTAPRGASLKTVAWVDDDGLNGLDANLTNNKSSWTTRVR